MDYDVEFINSLILADSKSFKDAVKKVPSDFVQGIERHVYNFIKKYFVDTKGKIPSEKAVIKQFPSFIVMKPDDALEYYIDQLHKRTKYIKFTKGNVEIQNALLSQDIDKAEDELRKLAQSIFDVQSGNSESVKQGLVVRKQKYLAAKRSKGVIGYLTGVEPLDNRLGGLQSEYFVILGKYGLGKTFFLLMLGLSIWKKSLNGPLAIVSLEMSKSAIEGRIDSVVGEFSYTKYRHGKLNKDEEQKLVGLKKLYSEKPEIIVISGAGKSLTELEYEILSVEPALVLYDGVYLTNMGHNDPFKDTYHASKGLQRMSKKYEIPVIATTQMIGEDMAKYARALNEDADIVMKLYRDKSMKDDRKMAFEMLKIREEDDELSWMMNWNFDTWDFSVDNNTPIEKAEMEYS